MKKILVIAWKDTLVRFTSLWEWMFFLILPVVFTLVLSGGTGGSSDDRIRLVVVDMSQTSLSAELITALEGSESVRPELMTLEQSENQFKQRRVSVMLIIPSGFEESTLQQGALELELRQQPNNLNAQAAAQALEAVVSRLGSAVEIARSSVAEAERLRPFSSEAERQAYFSTSLVQARTLLKEAPDRLTEVEGETPDQVEYDPRANSSAGQMITWVFVPLIGISGMFAYERQQGTLRRLLTTPARRSTYLLGTIFGQVVSALVQMLLLVGFGVLVLGIPWARQPAALAVLLVAACLAGAALGTALGAFVKTESQASGLSIMLGMVMALLGGCWYPIELFPEAVRTAVKVLPTTWAMQGMLDILLRGQGLAGILPEAGVLLGFALLFFAVGIMRFRYE